MRIDEYVEQLGEGLRQRGWRAATAESCTGGLVAKYLTDRAGSSEYFECGWVTYSNAAKMRLLGVSAATLEAHGAVSEQVAAAMARGAARAARVEASLAITGVAGPGGGGADKPVGMVWFATHDARAGVETVQRRFGGDRAAVREAAARFALELLLERL